ncbi:uncharacterized protein BP5553_09917 [Venustampulla echinocandica]|uniref:Uncharacterized protein n=1 Tax=Venustampulla echinocandica TaxID=2656787 RepID=A0A370TB39_9HELO|nr:uncharacterized protein BP5553_09917 [Venustampulla echinocandica]RDL31128.1 hypothetical protein BP5553_09917 [Venustampulla echinocandica]
MISETGMYDYQATSSRGTNHTAKQPGKENPDITGIAQRAWRGLTTQHQQFNKAAVES